MSGPHTGEGGVQIGRPTAAQWPAARGGVFSPGRWFKFLRPAAQRAGGAAVLWRLAIHHDTLPNMYAQRGGAALGGRPLGVAASPPPSDCWFKFLSHNLINTVAVAAGVGAVDARRRGAPSDTTPPAAGRVVKI